VTPRVPALKPRKVIRTFQNAGYILDHIEGSHYFFTHPRDRAILKRAKLTLEEFLRHDP